MEYVCVFLPLIICLLYMMNLWSVIIKTSLKDLNALYGISFLDIKMSLGIFTSLLKVNLNFFKMDMLTNILLL